MRISDWSSDVCSSDLRVERRRQRLEAVERGTHVDGYEGHPVRNAVLALVGLHHAGEGLQHRVHRRAVARRAALAETRNRQVDQSGIEPGKFFPAEAKSLCDTRTEAFDDHARLRRQTMHERPAAVGSEMEADRQSTRLKSSH